MALTIGEPVGYIDLDAIGIAFSTEETVLLAENGDILFGGDAGMQRVANGFEAAVQALVTGEWDKTFF